VKVLAVASRLHGKEYIERLLDHLNHSLEEAGLRIDNLIVDESEVEALGHEDLYLVFMLTGGTSRLVRALYEKKNRPTLILISHPYHNSLPSALSAKSRIEAAGGRVILYHTEGFNYKALEKLIKVIKAYHYIKNLKVILIGEETSEAKLFKKIVRNFEVINFEQVENKVSNTRIEDEDLELLSKKVDLSGAKGELLRNPLRLYKALKSLLNEREANAVAFDCFPFILRNGYTPCISLSLLLDEGIPAACEADLRSLLLLAASQSLTGEPGWIFNPSDYKKPLLIGAHCTVATSLTEYSTLLPHFETGNPYAVSGVIRGGTYTVAAVSPEFKELAAVKAEVVYSGTLSGGRCRTQAVLRLYEKDPRPFTDKAVSNHHVLIKGDVIEELRILANMLGMRFIYY
jgi:L-fucose isomerase-like protein